MAHDRLKHVSIFRSGTGAVIIANDTLGPINQNTGWLTDHLEMALAAYTSTPEQQHEILHPIPKMPWTNAAGQRLNTLQIRLARVEEIAAALPSSWFADYPVKGTDVFVVSATLIRIT
jgi:hypothetical protein